MIRLSSLLLALASLASFATTAPSQIPGPFDPVGTWNVSTVDDNGQPMNVVVQIAGKPGAHTGSATTSANRTIPLRELATTPNGMLMLFDLPQGAIVVRVVREGEKFVGAGGEVTQTFALTATRGK